MTTNTFTCQGTLKAIIQRQSYVLLELAYAAATKSGIKVVQVGLTQSVANQHKDKLVVGSELTISGSLVTTSQNRVALVGKTITVTAAAPVLKTLQSLERLDQAWSPMQSWSVIHTLYQRCGVKGAALTGQLSTN